MIPTVKSRLSLLLLLGAVGCAQFPGVGGMFSQSFKSLKPNGKADYDDGSDDAVESWIHEAGVEARGDRPIEYENDPLKDFLMSPKARSIERNLGID